MGYEKRDHYKTYTGYKTVSGSATNVSKVSINTIYEQTCKRKSEENIFVRFLGPNLAYFRFYIRKYHLLSMIT